MKNILFALMALFVVMAASVSAAPLTLISGVVTDVDSNVVAGANVKVTCNSAVKNVVTNAAGEYFAYFTPASCPVGSDVTVEVDKGEASGSDSGEVAYNGTCKLNTSVIDVEIPEFGFMATTLAVVGAIAGIAIVRRNN